MAMVSLASELIELFFGVVMTGFGNIEPQQNEGVLTVFSCPDGPEGVRTLCSNGTLSMTVFTATMDSTAASEQTAVSMEQPGIYLVYGNSELHVGCTDSLNAVLNALKDGQKSKSKAHVKLRAPDGAWCFMGIAAAGLAGGRATLSCLLTMIVDRVERGVLSACVLKRHGNCSFALGEVQFNAAYEACDTAVSMLSDQRLCDSDAPWLTFTSGTDYYPRLTVFNSKVAGHDIVASGEVLYELEGSSTVALRRGSHICRAGGRASPFQSLDKDLKARESLVAVNDEPGVYLLREDVVLSSYELAASFITGIAADSRIGWGAAPALLSLYSCKSAGHDVRGRLAIHESEGCETVQVLRGSVVMGPDFPGTSSHIAIFKEKLIAQGSLTLKGDYCVMEDDLIFKSRTQAGTFITGTRDLSRDLWDNGVASSTVSAVAPIFSRINFVSSIHNAQQ